LPDAKNIPVAKLAERIGELEKFKDKPIIVCCASGMRSNKACAELKKQGFEKLFNLNGGIDAWVGAGYPVKKGSKAK
jgi:rhodanese-related sulfurtransferase